MKNRIKREIRWLYLQTVSGRGIKNIKEIMGSYDLYNDFKIKILSNDAPKSMYNICVNMPDFKIPLYLIWAKKFIRGNK